MDRLLSLVDLYGNQEYNKIRDTWYLLGSFEVNNSTKAYIKDTIIKVNTGSEQGSDGSIIYVKENYIVGGAAGSVNWDSLEKDSVESLATTLNGTLTPAFFVLLTKDEVDSIEEPINEDYEPFFEETKRKGFAPVSTNIIINDSDLNIIMTEVGLPFLDWDEIEYSREQICELCVKPAMQAYYREFPIIKRVIIGDYGSGQAVKFELPENCIGIQRAEFRQGGTSGAGGFTGVHSYMNEQYQLGTIGNGASRFGRGVRYNKQVPGYTGVGSGGYQSLSMLNRSINQAVINYHKRTRLNIEIDEVTGKRVATGYSSTGGTLEAELKFYSPNFELIEYDELDGVRKLATARVMRSLSALRTLVKSDTPGAIDFSGYAARAETLENEVKEHYKNRPKAICLRGEA